MPNILAYFMLAVWPLVTLVLFLRLPVATAFVATIVAGYLLLPPPPAVFDLPLLPPVGKERIPVLAAFAVLWFRARGSFELLPRSHMARALLAVFILSPVLTYATNREPVFFGAIGLPGMRPFEAFALAIQQAMLALNFLLARAVLTGPKSPGLAEQDDGGDGLRLILLALFVGGLVYSVPMLIEVRLSPQLNNMIYGYFQHYFAQAIRGNGFRPLVFLNHGLWAAFFAMSAFGAALALWRLDRSRGRGLYLLLAGYLGAVLVACKTLGALLYGIALVPLIALLSTLWQIRLAAFIGLLAVAYPVLKTVDAVPYERLLSEAAKVSTERANSLRFRFDNEKILFERALRKPAFGWGTWGRNQILDPETGNFKTVTDGRWIITLGVFGWVGYIAEFGLLVLPLLALWRVGRRPGARLPGAAGVLALMLAINLVDLIPNATLTPITWMIAGALLGVAERARENYRAPVPENLRTVL